MIVALYIAAAAIMAAGSLYFAWRNRDFRKFLAGAFFVSSGILASRIPEGTHAKRTELAAC